MSVTASGNTTRYVQDLVSPLAQVLNDGSANYFYGLDRLAAQASSITTWYAYDGFGSVRQALDNAGVSLATAGYDPWGTPQGVAIAPFGFAGELQDGSGQVYLRARWYNPAIGTFPGYRWETSESNDRRPYSHHPYAYALGDPVNLTDPTGKCVPEYFVINGQRVPVPGGEPGCQPISELGTGPNWSDGGQYLWDVFEGIGSPGAWIVDQFAGTNNWDCIWQNASLGTRLGGAFTAVATAGGAYKHIIVPLAQRTAALLAPAAAGAGGVAGVVSKFRPSDVEAIDRFADDVPAAQAARGFTSFGTAWWKNWARIAASEEEFARNTFIHRTGERVTGIMVVSDKGTSIYVSQLEALGGGAGTRLLQAAVRESIARGYQGQLTLEAAPQAVKWYEGLGFVLQNNAHYLSAEAAERLLAK